MQEPHEKLSGGTADSDSLSIESSCDEYSEVSELLKSRDYEFNTNRHTFGNLQHQAKCAGI